MASNSLHKTIFGLIVVLALIGIVTLLYEEGASGDRSLDENVETHSSRVAEEVASTSRKVGLEDWADQSTTSHQYRKPKGDKRQQSYPEAERVIYEEGGFSFIPPAGWRFSLRRASFALTPNRFSVGLYRPGRPTEWIEDLSIERAECGARLEDEAIDLLLLFTFAPPERHNIDGRRGILLTGGGGEHGMSRVLLMEIDDVVIEIYDIFNIELVPDGLALLDQIARDVELTEKGARECASVGE